MVAGDQTETFKAQERCIEMQAARIKELEKEAADLEADLAKVGLMVVRVGGVGVALIPGGIEKLRAAFNL